MCPLGIVSFGIGQQIFQGSRIPYVIHEASYHGWKQAQYIHLDMTDGHRPSAYLTIRGRNRSSVSTITQLSWMRAGPHVLPQFYHPCSEKLICPVRRLSVSSDTVRHLSDYRLVLPKVMQPAPVASPNSLTSLFPSHFPLLSSSLLSFSGL